MAHDSCSRTMWLGRPVILSAGHILSLGTSHLPTLTPCSRSGLKSNEHTAKGSTEHHHRQSEPVLSRSGRAGTLRVPDKLASQPRKPGHRALLHACQAVPWPTFRTSPWAQCHMVNGVLPGLPTRAGMRSQRSTVWTLHPELLGWRAAPRPGRLPTRQLQGNLGGTEPRPWLDN